MADRVRRRKYYTRTSSNSSGSPRPRVEEDRNTMGKPRSDVSPGSGKETPEKRKVRPKRERWLLTRKTWRYMADAGRKLIPEGLQNRPEDVPKIEAYFQEVCHKEPRFLLWRKQSYPGALGFRSRGRSRGGRKKIGGSCRDRTSSADEAEDIKKGLSANITPQPVCRLDLKRLKEEFLLGFPNPSQPQPQTSVSSPEEESEAFLETLEMYLKEKPADPKAPGTSKSSLNHEELLSKLREYLDSIERVTAEERARSLRPPSVHFEGDHMQKMLLETIRRHFGKSTNREKVISDLLTDRKSLEKLYFDLRKTRGFQSARRSGDSVGGSPFSSSYSASRLRPLWRPSGSGSAFRYQDLREEEGSDDEVDDSRQVSSEPVSPPPVIEVIYDEPKEKCFATQTETMPESSLLAIQEELKRLKIAKQEAEEQDAKDEQRSLGAPKAFQRRSSVTDNDDVSPSVGDTIKRYLRMARKKSLDSDKTDRFKRVNYDKNIRNIKPRGEITQIGDDDGLDKGIQTEESWVVALKELKLEYRPDEVSPPPEDQSSSRLTSSRSSVDTGVEDMFSPPHTPVSPTKSSSGILSSGQTFLSNLLHHQKSRNVSSSVSAVPGVMQKSKSSSSVVHQGSRLVSKKIWKSRSKSQTRATPSATSAWTPQGTCQWTNVAGRTITLGETTLLQLSDIERRVLQKVALARLQALNLGVAVRIPSETVSAGAGVQKPKRRAYLLKRKAITTSFFDSKAGKDDKNEGGGMVFGIPLGQCVEQERLARIGKMEPLAGEDSELRRKAHHGSRTSFSSLIESAARGEKGSTESLICPTVSMPGLLDTLSVGSALDLSQDPGGVPNIVTSCLRHLENYGLHTLGIFRVSSSKKRVRQLREDFDCGKDIPMEGDLCPHDVATLLKEYFRDLPDSLLCKDLYPAFIQTQRIRNRRLQHEALQHLIQLLPVANRDTLWVLLSTLSQVALNCEDHRDNSGEWVVGNKMDSNNLATLFAPNILHPSKASKDEMSAERIEERSDAINVVRALIENYRILYQVSAELLHEVYLHMMDSHPEALDQILQRRDLATEETEDLEVSTVSEERLQASQESLLDERSIERKVWSREAFTHETAGMGGPHVEMKSRKERGRERVNKKRWRDEQGGGRRRLDSDHSTPSRRTSSTSYGEESLRPEDSMLYQGKTTDSGIITASLKIPVPQSAAFTLNLDDSDIPFIEDHSDRHQLTLGMVRSNMSSQRVSSDSSQASTYIHPVTQCQDSAVGSSVSPPRNSVSSFSSGGVFSSPPSWASSPPTSPDATHANVDYLPEEPTTARITIPTKKTTPDPQQRVTIQRVTIKTAGEVQQVKQTYSRQESASAVLSQERRRSRDAGSQRLPSSGVPELAKSVSVTTVAVLPQGQNTERTTSDRSVTPSISNIGGAVLRSKTADIERMLKLQTTSQQTKKSMGVTVSSEEEKKIKRKYTDSRHQTRTLVQPAVEGEVDSEATASSRTTEQRRSGVVYKRRELISSEPKERRGFFN